MQHGCCASRFHPCTRVARMAEETPNPTPESEAPSPEQSDETPRAESAPEPSAPEAADDDAAQVAQATAELADDALAEAEAAVQSVTEEAEAAQPVDLPTFENGAAAEDGDPDFQMLSDVNLNVKVELGRTRIYVEDVLRLNENSVIELDKAAGDPVDIYVNDRKRISRKVKCEGVTV